MRSVSLAAGAVLALLAAAAPARAQPQSLTGTWTVAGENRYEDCTVWTPRGRLTVDEIDGAGRYRGHIEITGRTTIDKSCRNPPAEPPSDAEDRFESDVELSLDKDIVTIRELQLNRAFRYRWTARGLEFQLDSCREAAPCTATTFRYERQR